MPIWGEAPTVPIRTELSMVGSLADVITCAKFQVKICRGYVFTRGRVSHFPIDFCMGLRRVQRDCAACDEPLQTDLGLCIYFLLYLSEPLEA